MNTKISRRARSLVAHVAVVLGAAASAASCQAIAGIEDRTYVGQQESALCEDYCTTVMATCVEDKENDVHFSVYPSKDACLAVCGRLEPGDPNEEEPKGNTVACRLHAAKLAESSREYPLYCPQAGPGGAEACGTDCESYCQLFDALCPARVIDCVDKCKVFENDGSFDAVRDHDGDTLQCRLVHVSNAALDEVHCGHAAFTSNQYCVAKDVTCEHYCDVVMTTCSAELEVYDDRDQCLEVCSHLDLGKPTDIKEDTVGCRTYHSYNAYVTNQPKAHCPHAGPGGDAHCGTSNCPAYCRLVEAACSAQFISEFGTNDKCVEACGKLDGAKGDTGTVIANSAGNNVICRLVETSRAFADPAHCPAAIGQDDPCR